MTRRGWLGLALAGAAGAAPKADRAKLVSRELLRVPFWMDGNGSLEAKLNGVPAAVVEQRGPEDDLLILMVLDLAGDLAQVDPARQAIIANLERLPANCWVALLRAQDGLRTLVDPGPDRGPIITAIRELGISGRAGLLDTIEMAASVGDTLLERSSVRVAVLYITDSTIGNYREDFTNPVVNSSDGRDMSRRFPEGLIKEKIRQLNARLSSLETPVFIVHLNYQNDRLSEAYQTGLLSLANTTGATASFCRSLAEIPSAIDTAFASILSMRFATIEMKAVKARQIDVLLTSTQGTPRYRARYVLKGK